MQDSPHRFSVVIPLYNKQSSVTRAIESVLQQEVQDFEIVVVNDGSTDASASRVRAIEDDRIHLYDKANGGVSDARNFGIEKSRFPLVAFLDADDAWLPDFLTRISALIDRFPGAGAYATNYYMEYLGGERQIAKLRYVPKDAEGGLIDSYVRSTAFTSSPVTSSSVCVPREVFDSVGIFSTDMDLYEDLEMWLRISLRYPIAFLDEPLAIYRRGAENRACIRIVPSMKSMSFAPLLTDAVASGELQGEDARYAVELINRYALQNAFKSVVGGNSPEARKLLSKVRIRSMDRFIRFVFIYGLSILPTAVVSRLWETGKALKS